MKSNLRRLALPNTKVVQRAAGFCGALCFVNSFQTLKACETVSNATTPPSSTRTSSTRSVGNSDATLSTAKSRFVDARALAILRRADATYRALGSFKCVVCSKTIPRVVEASHGNVTVFSNDKHRVEWQKPHFARVITQSSTTTNNAKSGAKTHRSEDRKIANGDEMWTFSSSFDEKVMQYKSRRDHGTATQIALRQASGSLEDLLSGGLAKNIDEPCFSALTYLGESFVGNVAVERVQWNFVDTESRTSEVLSFDKRGFLRAVNIEYSNDDSTFRQAETFTNLQTNPRIAPRTFALVLPKGARLLTVEQMQAEMMREYEIADAADAKNSAAN